MKWDDPTYGRRDRVFPLFTLVFTLRTAEASRTKLTRRRPEVLLTKTACIVSTVKYMYRRRFEGTASKTREYWSQCVAIRNRSSHNNTDSVHLTLTQRAILLYFVVCTVEVRLNDVILRHIFTTRLRKWRHEFNNIQFSQSIYMAQRAAHKRFRMRLSVVLTLSKQERVLEITFEQFDGKRRR